MKTAEEKLAEFRAKKTQDSKESLSSRFQGAFNSWTNKQSTNKNSNEDESEHFKESEETKDVQPQKSHQTHWIVLILKLALWGILWALFIEIQFGAVYIVISLFYLMYTNTRTQPSTPGAPSAYSVFNPNCESIDGTLDPDQFDKELRHGPMSVKKSH